MSGRRALIPRKLIDDAAQTSVAHNSVVEIERDGFKLRVTPAKGAAHLAAQSDLDDRIAKGEGF